MTKTRTSESDLPRSGSGDTFGPLIGVLQELGGHSGRVVPSEGTKERLEKAGWRVGTTEEFLGLSPDEAAFVDMKLSLATELRRKRRARHLTQAQEAKMLESSQSGVAKMEAASPSESMDLLVKALLAIGASRSEVAAAISSHANSAPDG